MNNLHYYILIGAGVLLIILFLIFAGILPGGNVSSPGEFTLEFWGVEGDSSFWRDIGDSFKKEYPYITLNYTRFDEESYEDVLVNRLAEGRGPDIFFLKNSWITKHRDKINPFPQESLRYTDRDFRKEFVDAASDDLITQDGNIWGLPLYLDTLALFYNKDIFNTESVAEPPATWDETLEVSRRVLKRNEKGAVTRSSVALGSFKNIDHAFEIVSALIMQNGDNIVDRGTRTVYLDERAKEAVKFYVSFVNPLSPNFSGSLGVKSSLDALADGSAVMALGMSRDIKRVRAKNPHINLGVAPLPQPKDASRFVNYGSYYFPAVSRLSQNPEAAWVFVRYITSRDVAKKYIEVHNRPAARRDLVNAGGPTDEMAVFYRQSLTARTWPVPDEASAERIFRDMIESSGSRETEVNRAVDRAREQLRLLLP